MKVKLKKNNNNRKNPSICLVTYLELMCRNVAVVLKFFDQILAIEKSQEVLDYLALLNF
jgi:hypothetical protein